MKEDECHYYQSNKKFRYDSTTYDRHSLLQKNLTSDTIVKNSKIF